MREKYRQLTKEDRLRLEVLYNAGHSKSEIASLLGVHLSTIYRELSRGAYQGLHSELYTVRKYSADIAQKNHDDLASVKGAPLKIGNHYALANYIEDKIINQKYSPAAVSADLRGSIFPYLSEGTIYRYVRLGIFLNLRAEHLPEHGQRKHPYKRVVSQYKKHLGTSIEKRPAEIAERSSFGHWEMDSVVGFKAGKGESILVLTERLTRFEICLKVPDKTAVSTVRAIDRLQSQCNFKEIFKTITVDNGTEFADNYRLEFSKANKKRTSVYYCHPYTSCERGSNENANRMLRRWFPHKRSLKNVTQAQCTRVAAWLNTYPREVLGWKTASQAFIEACDLEGIKISSTFSQYLS